MTNRRFLCGILFLTVLLLFNNGCRKDPKSNEDIFSQLEGQDGIYTFKVPPALFIILARSEVPSGEMIDMIGEIENVKLLLFDPTKSKSKTAGNISDEIFASFREFGYELVIRVSHEGADFAAYILDNGDYVTDLMVVITDESSVKSIGLTGKLDSNSITNFAAVMDYSRIKELMDNY